MRRPLTASLLLLGLGFCGLQPVLAQDDYRQPGTPAPDQSATAPTDNGAIAAPSPDLDYRQVPIPDRSRLMDALGVPDSPGNPYRQSTLKGDRPVFDDWYVELGATADSLYEARAVPVPVNVVTDYHTGANDPFGHPNQILETETLIPSLSIIEGDTSFRPPDIELRVSPAINWTRLHVDELGLTNADPAFGTVRDSYFVGWQEAFLDYHLQNVSDRYDFDAIRVGIQPINADFRGFLFQDQQLGVRLFGDRDNNRFQYNLAYFRRIEKDTNSGLNDLGQPLRRDNIAMANLFVQDLPASGYTTEFSVLQNWNIETDDYYDKDNFLTRPAALGLENPHKYSVTYLGLNGDGHFGRMNLTTSFYYAAGNDSLNELSGNKAEIRAYFAAAEPSIDFDWLRVRGSFLFASGDHHPGGSTEGGFDAINQNPQFAGADASYWIRQGIPFIGGGGVMLTGRNNILPSLRSSSDEGQSNFVNPGLLLLGVGADIDVLPELRIGTNVNHLSFDDTAVLEALREQAPISRDIGWDMSVAVTWRPFETQNVILRTSTGFLVPEQGFNELLTTQPQNQILYSVLANLILTY